MNFDKQEIIFQFKPAYLLNPVYLFNRAKALRSYKALVIRLISLPVLVYKLLSGRYGEIYWAKQRENRKEELEGIIKLNPVNGNIHNELGDLYIRRGDHKSAIKELQKAVESGVNNCEIHLELGRLYSKEREEKKALQEFNKALKFNSGNGWIHFEMGLLYEKLNDFNMAVKEFESAIQAGVDNKKVHLELGWMYSRNQKNKLALEELKRALEFDPEDGQIHFEMGLIYHRINDPDSALAELEKAYKGGCRNGDVFWELGRIYDEKDEQELAEKNYFKAIEKEASNKNEAYFALARLFDKNEKYEDAVEYYEKGLKKQFEREAALRLVFIYKLIDKWDKIGPWVKNNLKNVQRRDLFLKNLFLNELEISQKKIILDSKPRSLTVTLTNRCNLQCVMCEVRNAPWEIPGNLLNEIVSLFPYLEHIMWQGGEVFMMKEFHDILKETKKFPQIRQVITSNGLLLSKDIIKELVTQPDLVLTLSMDGVDKDTFERIRKGSNYEKFMKNLNLMNKMRREFNSDLRLNLNVTVMKSNFDKLIDFIEFAHTHNFFSVFLAPVTGNMNNSRNIFYHKSQIELDKMLIKIGEVEGLAKKYDLILHNRLPVNEIQGAEFVPSDEEKCYEADKDSGQQETEEENESVCFGDNKPGVNDDNEEKPPHLIGPLWYDVENEANMVELDKTNPKFNQSNRALLCYAPWQRLYVDWWGNVFPDCMCLPEKPAGNIENSSFAQIWNSKGMQMYRKKMLEENNADLCQPGCLSGRIPSRYLRYNR